MPPWFRYAMEMCESLSLDDPTDRERLWERVWEAIPRANVREALADHIEEWLVRVGGMTRTETAEIIDGLSSSSMMAALSAMGDP